MVYLDAVWSMQHILVLWNLKAGWIISSVSGLHQGQHNLTYKFFYLKAMIATTTQINFILWFPTLSDH